MKTRDVYVDEDDFNPDEALTAAIKKGNFFRERVQFDCFIFIITYLLSIIQFIFQFIRGGGIVIIIIFIIVFKKVPSAFQKTSQQKVPGRSHRSLGAGSVKMSRSVLPWVRLTC